MEGPEIERWVDDLLAKRRPPHASDPPWVRKLRAHVAERDALEQQAAGLRLLLTHITSTLMRLAALDFADPAGVEGYEATGDDVVDAVHLGLSMMSEELAASQQALKNARDEAIEADRTKSSFLASMSHELRTPLNVVIGYCELASEEAEDGCLDGLQQDLQQIRTAASHLLGLISDVLDLSKIEAGHMAVEMGVVEVGPLVSEVSEAVRHMAESNGNQIRLDLERAPQLWADEGRLRQVLFNLLGNAAKYTHNGKIDVSAGLSDEHRGWIEVRDTGVGIEAQHLQRIFQPFFRVVERGCSPGTGLGLAITERLCRMMGGDIEVQSTFGAGSTFRVSFSTRPLETPCP